MEAPSAPRPLEVASLYDLAMIASALEPFDAPGLKRCVARAIARIEMWTIEQRKASRI